MIIRSIIALGLALLASGCARIVSVAEALQQPVDGKVYLGCNIWYQDPNDISSVNYQKGGRFIRFGTEIEVVEADECKIVFKDTGGNQYTIKYDRDMMMLPIQDYIRQVFTLKSKAELTKDMEPEFLDAIERGVIIRGMTRAEARMACGPPPAFRTPDQLNSTWVYFLEKNMTYRVIFSGTQVEMIMNIND